MHIAEKGFDSKAGKEVPKNVVSKNVIKYVVTKL